MSVKFYVKKWFELRKNKAQNAIMKKDVFDYVILDCIEILYKTHQPCVSLKTHHDIDYVQR